MYFLSVSGPPINPGTLSYLTLMLLMYCWVAIVTLSFLGLHCQEQGYTNSLPLPLSLSQQQVQRELLQSLLKDFGGGLGQEE